MSGIWLGNGDRRPAVAAPEAKPSPVVQKGSTLDQHGTGSRRLGRSMIAADHGRSKAAAMARGLTQFAPPEWRC